MKNDVVYGPVRKNYIRNHSGFKESATVGLYNENFFGLYFSILYFEKNKIKIVLVRLSSSGMS
jgi:hypothetical protein